MTPALPGANCIATDHRVKRTQRSNKKIAYNKMGVYSD